jgi:hypothetical protein
MGHQRQLQECWILSSSEIKSVYGYVVFRTHSSIETSLPELKKKTTSHQPDVEEAIPLPPLDITEEQVIEYHPFQLLPTRHVPRTHTPMMWSQEELSILQHLFQKGQRSYDQYLHVCKSRGVPDRSKKSFYCKFRQFKQLQH